MLFISSADKNMLQTIIEQHTVSSYRASECYACRTSSPVQCQYCFLSNGHIVTLFRHCSRSIIQVSSAPPLLQNSNGNPLAGR